MTVPVEGTVKEGSQGEREAGVREAVREAAVGTQGGQRKGRVCKPERRVTRV